MNEDMRAMEISELRALFERAMKRSRDLEAKYRAGFGLTRAECDEMRHCTQRLGLIGRELWITLGKPDDAEFECFRNPIKLNPLPESMRSKRYDNAQYN
jgi:hypothetical protein